MKRFPQILAVTCAALVLTASLALAAEAPKKAKAAPAKPVAGQMAPMGGEMMGGGMMGGMMGGMGGQMGMKGQMGLEGLSPEKQELAKAIMAEHHEALFPLHQSLYAKGAELEALNAAGNGESDQARAVIRDIVDLKAKMLTENGRFRARLVKETGLRTPPMGHGMMGGGMMGGMKGGGMSCPMMEGMMKGGKMGGMMGGMKGGMKMDGAAPAAPAGKAPAKADAHSM